MDNLQTLQGEVACLSLLGNKGWREVISNVLRVDRNSFLYIGSSHYTTAALILCFPFLFPSLKDWGFRKSLLYSDINKIPQIPWSFCKLALRIKGENLKATFMPGLISTTPVSLEYKLIFQTAFGYQAFRHMQTMISLLIRWDSYIGDIFCLF